MFFGQSCSGKADGGSSDFDNRSGCAEVAIGVGGGARGAPERLDGVSSDAILGLSYLIGVGGGSLDRLGGVSSCRVAALLHCEGVEGGGPRGCLGGVPAGARSVADVCDRPPSQRHLVRVEAKKGKTSRLYYTFKSSYISIRNSRTSAPPQDRDSGPLSPTPSKPGFQQASHPLHLSTCSNNSLSASDSNS
jgi:hypothetical protein